MGALAHTALSHDEARSLTDDVRDDAERLWRKLVELYEGRAHLVLGYSSWESYFRTEFGGSRAQAYQLLDAGRVVRALQSTGVDSLPGRSQARELAPLKDSPEALREAWAEANRRSDRPTKAEVREAVAEHAPEMGRKATLNANAAKRRLSDGISSVSGYCSGLGDPSTIERALPSATAEDIANWDRLASDAIRSLSSFRRAVREAKYAL